MDNIWHELKGDETAIFSVNIIHELKDDEVAMLPVKAGRYVGVRR